MHHVDYSNCRLVWVYSYIITLHHASSLTHFINMASAARTKKYTNSYEMLQYLKEQMYLASHLSQSSTRQITLTTTSEPSMVMILSMVWG